MTFFTRWNGVTQKGWFNSTNHNTILG